MHDLPVDRMISSKSNEYAWAIGGQRRLMALSPVPLMLVLCLNRDHFSGLQTDRENHVLALAHQPLEEFHAGQRQEYVYVVDAKRGHLVGVIPTGCSVQKLVAGDGFGAFAGSAYATDPCGTQGGDRVVVFNLSDCRIVFEGGSTELGVPSVSDLSLRDSWLHVRGYSAIGCRENGCREVLLDLKKQSLGQHAVSSQPDTCPPLLADHTDAVPGKVSSDGVIGRSTITCGDVEVQVQGGCWLVATGAPSFLYKNSAREIGSENERQKLLAGGGWKLSAELHRAYPESADERAPWSTEYYSFPFYQCQGWAGRWLEEGLRIACP